MSLPHFIFSGTSYEQGLSHGEALKDSIEKNIDVYLNRFESEAGISKDKLIDNAGIYLAVLREQSPEYVNGIYFLFISYQNFDGINSHFWKYIIFNRNIAGSIS